MLLHVITQVKDIGLYKFRQSDIKVPALLFLFLILSFVVLPSGESPKIGPISSGLGSVGGCALIILASAIIIYLPRVLF